MDSVAVRVCSKCGAAKPETTEFFYFRQEGYFRKACKACMGQPRQGPPKAKVSRGNPTRLCTACHQEKPNTRDFYPYSNRALGRFASVCLECRRARDEAYRRENRPKIRAQQQAWEDANREALRERRKDIYRAAPERQKARRNKYLAVPANAERGKATARKWRQANPEKLRAKAARRRAKLLASPLHYTSDDVHKRLQEQKGLCYWCHKPLGGAYHVDHIIPLAKGGTNAPNNICCACPGCNQSKGAKMPCEFAGRLF